LRRLMGHRAVVRALAFSPDGKRLASGGMDGAVRLWEVAPPPALPPITNVFGVFCFSDDGRRLLTQDKEGTVTLYDLSTRLPLQTWPNLPFEDATFATNGRLLLISKSVSNSPPQLTLLETAAPLAPCARRLEANAAPCTAAAMVPGGVTCVTGHEDGTLAFWDVATGSLRQSTRPHTNSVFRFACSRDGHRVAAVTWDQTWISVWDSSSGRMLSDRHFPLRFAAALAVSPDGARYAMGGASVGSSIRIFESVDAKAAGVLTGHLDDVRRLSFSPDGLTLASTGIDHNLKLWHLATGRPLLTLPQGEMQEFLAFSPDGAWLAMATARGELRLWHAPPYEGLAKNEAAP
jgi:WD40 repeat protein